MENDTDWLLPENLKNQEERERQAVEQGTFDGSGDFGSYYAYRQGLREDFIRLHVMIDEPSALIYAKTLRHFLSHYGYGLKGRILDVGCAIGTITNALHRLNPQGETLGLDISRDAIEVAREKYPACAFHDRSADDLDVFKDASLDIIHAREFYPFTRTNDPDFHQKYVRLFWSKLKPGGLLVLQMAARTKGFHHTFPKLQPALFELGYARIIRGGAPPRRLAKLLGESLQNRRVYRAACALTALASLFGNRPRSCFYILEKRA